MYSRIYRITLSAQTVYYFTHDRSWNMFFCVVVIRSDIRPQIERVQRAIVICFDIRPRIERVLSAVVIQFDTRPRIERVLCAVSICFSTRPRIERVLCAVVYQNEQRPRIEHVLSAVVCHPSIRAEIQYIHLYRYFSFLHVSLATTRHPYESSTSSLENTSEIDTTTRYAGSRKIQKQIRPHPHRCPRQSHS